MCGMLGGMGHGIPEYVKSKIDSLKHRGPDSQKILNLSDNLTLAASRLAMTDPTPRSDQPMVEPETGNVIVFNGEIFNFLELRKILEEKGSKFNTTSDTEVVLKFITRFKDNIDQLEGMFAFCHYNKDSNKIILARDFLGKKPLYYSIGNNYFIFSSKVNLVKNYLEKTSLDNLSLSTYLKFGYLINPNTMFKEIKSVQAGEVISIDLSTLKINEKFKFIPVSILKPPEIELRKVLENSFIERVRGHEKIALSLSGGIDSSVLAFLSSSLGVKCKTYSMRWPESDKERYNYDSQVAEEISKKLGLDFQIVDMPKVNKIADELSKYVSIMEEPNSNPSGLSMMSLYKQISLDGTRLVLTGDGGDEIFGGYRRYGLINRLDYMPQISEKTLNKLHLETDFNQPNLSRLYTSFLEGKSLDFWSYWQRVADDGYLKSFFNEYKKYIQELDDYLHILGPFKNKRLPITMIRDLKIWLAMESNTRLDRVSMAHSIEARSPFLSEKIIGTGYREMKKNSFKILNKEILTNRFPELKDLPKMKTKVGFISPLGFWLRNNSELINDCLRYVPKYFDFDKKILQLLANSPQQGNYHKFNFLWSIIVLAQWHNSQFSQ
jgi:asparagine synthase (glutamine-hydrolysing)